MSRRGHVHPRRGFAAVGIYHPKHGVNVGSLWRAASLYGAAMIFTVGRRYDPQASDTPGTIRRVPLLHFADVDDLIAHLPLSCPLVGVEMAPAAVPLERFAHPERAAYLLGAEDHGLPQRVIDRCHRLVQIESPSDESMNVACAGSIVLWHRHNQASALSKTA